MPWPSRNPRDSDAAFPQMPFFTSKWPHIDSPCTVIGREDDERVQQVLAKLTNTDVLSAVTAERSLLAALRAGCHAPLGALTMLDGDNLGLQGVLLSLDGTTRLEATSQGHRNEAADLGIAVAEQLLSQGGDKLVEAF